MRCFSEDLEDLCGVWKKSFSRSKPTSSKVPGLSPGRGRYSIRRLFLELMWRRQGTSALGQASRSSGRERKKRLFRGARPDLGGGVASMPGCRCLCRKAEDWQMV